MHLLAYLLLTCLGMGASVGVRIVRLAVPSLVQAGSGPILLDCEYVLAEGRVPAPSMTPSDTADTSDVTDWTKEGLLIKWYIDDLPVYQWIPPRHPQALGVLAGRVDPSYRASTHPWAVHRALYIPRPHPALSGRYSCTVSTFEDEDTRSASLLVWSEAQQVSLNYWRPAEHLVNVTCVAEGAAPRPRFALYALHPDGTRVNIIVRGATAREGEGGWWWAGAWGLLEWTSTPTNTTLGCTLTLPGAPPTLTPQICEEVYDNDLPIITTTTTTTTTSTASPQVHDRWTNNETGSSSSSSSPVNESFSAMATRVRLSPALVCLTTVIITSTWRLLLAASP